MNILELDTYSLDDAVKFHDRLNPRLWGRDEHLRPEVAAKLREIAADFQEFLGVDALDVVDITVSGSNAAFSYTPHSDIDLHLVINMPEENRDVYQELFNAKKYQYNDEHNIKIRGADVELYAQPSDENPKSQGIYSLMHNKWIQIPKRRKAEIDDSCVKSKVEDLDQRIHSAIKSGDQAHMQSLWNKIKEMRKSGLETNGEFGCENLAFKILRTNGCLKELKTALNAARDTELGMAEQYSQPVIYGYATGTNEDVGSTPDGVSASTKMFVSETEDARKMDITRNFIRQTAKWLGIVNMPKINVFSDPKWSAQEHTFGRYLPHEHQLEVNVANRHIMDILRTVAHELAHCRQHEIDPMPDDAGDTGSPWENEAHAVAGVIMRHYADEHPNLFESVKAGAMSRTVLAAVIAMAANMAQGQEYQQQPNPTASALRAALTVYGLSKITKPQVQSALNQEVKNYIRAQGGDEGARNQSWAWRYQQQYQQPEYNQPQGIPQVPVNENASGYIPTAREKNDPRYSMALTVDIKPGQVGKEANKLALKTNKQGKPALLMKTANMIGEALDKPEMTVPELAKKHRVSVDKIKKQLAKGIRVEKEHTTSDATAREIALDHLAEFPDYYDRLEKAETREGLELAIAREFALFEDQDLFEVKMSPSNLKREAAKTGAMAGMEFEMIVPNVSVDEEPNYEPDYDQDQRTRSFSDIVNFFYDGDYNGRRDVVRLEEELQDQFGEWLEEQIDEAWASDGFDYLRDYIENNDYFDEEEATEEVTNALQAEYGDDISPEDFQKMLDALVKEKFDEFVQSQWDDQGRYYDDALDQFRDEQRQDIDESDWLQEHYPYMTDIQNNFDIAWPYYYDTNEGDGDMDIETVADDFSRAVGMRVNWSSNYHGGRREPDAYVVEPDGSLSPDNSGDGGLEFVSPPMPIDKMIDQLNKVKAWAGDYGCYTNRSTGLHINISVPNYDLDKLDYVKLALLLGDKYILDQYGRSSNTYAKSALGKVQDLIKRDPSKGKELLDKMRGHMEDLATKSIHSGSTDKYTSINTKTGYIEFRSPGGDWLDANFDKIENTLLRFTVALSAAMDPQAYREEYLKKLYKLLEPVAEEAKGLFGKGAKDTVKYFADYVAGKTPRAALRSFVKQAQLERKIKKDPTGGQKYWWDVSRPGYFASIEVVASSREEAIDKAIEPGNYPDWARARNTLQAKPLRPYDASPVKATVGAPQPAGGMRPSNPDGNYVIFSADSRAGDPPAYRFMAADNDDADIVLLQWSREHPGNWEVHYDPSQRLGQPPIPGSTLDLQRQRAAAAQQSSGQEPAIWYVSVIGRPGTEIQVRARNAGEAQGQAHTVRPDIFGDNEGNIRASTVSVSQAAAQQQPTQQPAPRPLGAGRELVGWSVRLPDGQEVAQFHGIGNNQGDANRIAADYLRQQGMGVSGEGFEVVPIWREA